MARIQQIMSQKQVQRLELRPKMLQSLHLLSLPIMELDMHIKQELISNPLLDDLDENPSETGSDEEAAASDQDSSVDEEYSKTLEEVKELSEVLDHWNEYNAEGKGGGSSSDDESPSMDQYLKLEENKKELFIQQLDRFALTDDEYEFAAELIDTANAHGFLPEGFCILDLAAEYGIEEERADEIHQIILHLDPKGVTSRNLSECLLVQLEDRQQENGLLVNIIKNDFNDLIHRRYQQIATRHKVTIDAVMDCKDEISRLDPKPGLRLEQSEVTYTVPDVIIKRVEDEFVLIINDSSMPRIGINRGYKSIINSVRKDREALGYVRNKINSAKFLIKSMYMRNRTLERVTRSIIEHQRNFFYNESGVLEPLTYSVIAAELQVNESTISRVVRTKYADTPFGIWCLKDFFTSTAGKDKNYEAVSRQMVERHIVEMVEVEDKHKPISDQDIANILKEKGISVSRRVIAKYREGLGILNSRLRRKEVIE